MTTLSQRIARPYGIGFTCGIASLLLAGLFVNSAMTEQVSMFKVISDSPVHMTVSTQDVRDAKTNGTTVLVLPNHKLSLAGS